MLDQGTTAHNITMQRARGDIAVALGLKAGQTKLMRLRQAGSAKVFLPKIHGPVPELVCVNTAGGLASGDIFSIDVSAGPGTRATATTQTAERGYRAEGPPATVSVRLRAGDGASLAWLPQETILFQRAGLRRSIDAQLDGTARVLILESLVFGRAAMGESLDQVMLHDRWRVTRDGRLIYADDLRFDGDVRAVLHAPVGFAGHRAAASLAYLAPGAGDLAQRFNRLDLPDGVRLSASGWEGVLSLRCLAPTAQLLRRALMRVLAPFDDHPLPRVWQS
ncbi:MAG: urease accessory protein UreD [Pseudomonadota bacterium]